jgi:hypothetical protein
LKSTPRIAMVFLLFFLSAGLDELKRKTKGFKLKSAIKIEHIKRENPVALRLRQYHDRNRHNRSQPLMGSS